jgi:probable HAF family extracellular repeat protein
VPALGINNNGWVTLQAPYFIRAEDTNGDGVADTWFRDLDGDGVNDLRVPLAVLAGGSDAAPQAINDGNLIAGAADNGNIDSVGEMVYHAVTWGGEGTIITDIGTLSGDEQSWSNAINNNGQVVGGTGSNVTGAFRPFVWDPAHGMRDLNAMLPAGSRWVITEATCINDNSEISGVGSLNGGGERAFLLRPISSATQLGTTVSVTPSTTVPLTLTFDSVLARGSTTATTSNTAPALPEGFQVSGTFIDIQTTATFSGLVDVCVAYNPSVFPYYPDGATEDDRWPGGKPRLMHYDTTISRWVNITTSVNPQNRLVCGQTASFSPFAVVKEVPVSYSIVALYDQTKAYKSGSTLPIKVQLRDATGANVSSSSITVTATAVTQISNSASGALVDSGNANPDNNFRYDTSLAGYIFNLSLKGYATGTYRLSFKAGIDAATHTVAFQVK